MGYVMAYDRLNLVPRHTAGLDLAGMVRSAELSMVDEVVDYFIRRFLRVPLAGDPRAVLVTHLQEDLGSDRVPATTTPQVELALRSLLYLVLSTPEYQLA